MAQEKRVVADCRKYPEGKCGLAFTGSEKEVVEAATQHAVSKHGMTDTPELRNKIREGLEEEHPVSVH
jgi:predicted small metal-binding protein